ncbi:thiamine monophosphate synthase [Pelistega indica]|uniref:8-oxo-dGTP diphosphatase n=1 Tax=Pelistega indica TaxID=1414851 RepID=V8FZU5_9BURK|nr:Nudix family hydrolase [Pelistega indica]ETD68947.1 thiamine monophosphate synthase [Pelistega indica]
MNKPFIRVAVGVVLNPQGQVLLAQRPEDKPWAGWWEFPGGKIESGETEHQALARELKEELDITIGESYPWVHFTYEYPKTIVELSFRRVYTWNGEVRGLEQQAFAWTTPEKAHDLGELLPASVAPLKWLNIPGTYAISHFATPDQQEAYWQQFDQLLAQGVKLFQFREPTWHDGVGSTSLKALFDAMLVKCHAHGAKLLVNSIHPRAWWTLADGVQLRAQDAVQLEERPIPGDKLMGVSCHHLADILYANVLNADFVVLGHVEATPSHPNQPPLGWEQFQQFAQEAGRPVFAIGGQSIKRLEKAREHGAHGVAFMRG